ncbi:MAG: lipoprotein signal peptidase [Mangrovibacterium sp.]
MTKLQKSGLLIALILIIDQASKIWIKTNMMLGEEFNVLGDWFKIHFVENNGMAFGFEFAGEYGKVFLTVFRIVAVGFIGWYLVKICKANKLPMGFIVCVALIFAGAMGNIIDCVFYGVVFDHSYGQLAQLFPEAGGYSSWLHGKVVDMLYFPLIDTRYPDWMPFVGGNTLQFFRPVFNVADSAISVGIGAMLIFYWRTLNVEMATPKKES